MNWQPEAAPLPQYSRVPQVVATYGISRTRLYVLASEGSIRFVKAGRATLVDLNSVRAFLASLPQAKIRLKKAD